MSLPDPEPGLVIRYSYLWHNEARQGREDGTKDRPCAIVLARKRDHGETIVVVAPITHNEPAAGASGVEIPIAVKRRLALDLERSWIITDDVNMFTWPGPDIRPVADDAAPRFAYGFLPQRLTDQMLDAVREHARGRVVSRDD